MRLLAEGNAHQMYVWVKNLQEAQEFTGNAMKGLRKHAIAHINILQIRFKQKK